MNNDHGKRPRCARDCRAEYAHHLARPLLCVAATDRQRRTSGLSSSSEPRVLATRPGSR